MPHGILTHGLKDGEPLHFTGCRGSHYVWTTINSNGGLMKNIIVIASGFLLAGLCLTSVAAEDKIKNSNGVYYSTVSDSVIPRYIADTRTQLCFASFSKMYREGVMSTAHTGNPENYVVVQIPCENLAKLPEWQSSINWTKK
jgi:hypothetical protein